MDEPEKKSAIDLKWEAVADFYQRGYGVVFARRLPDEKIEWLYSEMQKLKESMAEHRSRACYVLHGLR